MDDEKTVILKVLAMSEDDLVFEKLNNHDWFRKMDDSLQKEMVNSIFLCAQQAYEDLIKQFGDNTTDEYAKKLGVEICESEDVPSELFLHFALFQTPPHKISLTMPSIRMASDYIKKNCLENEFKNVDIRGFALSHELFHVLEELHPDYYTISKKIEKRGLFSKKLVSPKILSEMGARYFSMFVQKTSITTGALETLLVLAFREYEQIRKDEFIKNNRDKIVKFYTKLRPNK